MIKLEKTEVMGWEPAIRGMRNPMNSWDRMDSEECAHRCYTHCSDDECPMLDETGHCNLRGRNKFIVGPNDHELMMKLVKGGPVHAKFRRMITVYVDITAPLYWWKEFDTYKVGAVANSCSTMHKIHAKEFTLEDFSHEHLMNLEHDGELCRDWLDTLECLIDDLNVARKFYLETKDKSYWWQMIQLLPSSYNQKRTVELNYEVLAGIYISRKNHKLDEWREFCKWIEELPYSEIIIGG